MDISCVNLPQTSSLYLYMYKDHQAFLRFASYTLYRTDFLCKCRNGILYIRYRSSTMHKNVKRLRDSFQAITCHL